MLDSASHNGVSDPKWLEENVKPDATDVIGDTVKLRAENAASSLR